MGISIRSSYDSFRALRENGGYYIDKTKMLEEYLERRFDRAVQPSIRQLVSLVANVQD